MNIFNLFKKKKKPTDIEVALLLKIINDTEEGRLEWYETIIDNVNCYKTDINNTSIKIEKGFDVIYFQSNKTWFELGWGSSASKLVKTIKLW